MRRLDGDDARCIRNRAVQGEEHPEAESIARNAVRGKSGGGQLLAKRNALNQKRALADLRELAGAPANAHRARGLEPESSRTVIRPKPATQSVPATVQVRQEPQMMNRSTDTRALTESPDSGVPYDAGTNGPPRKSLVTFEDIEDSLESENDRLDPQDSYTGIEWLDKRGGELRPYVSGENEDFPPELRTYLDTPNFHSGFRPVRRTLEEAQSGTGPSRKPLRPKPAEPRVHAKEEGERVTQPHVDVAVTRSWLLPPMIVRQPRGRVLFSEQGEKVDRPAPPLPKDQTLPKDVPEVYSARKILFEGTRDRSGKTVKFAPGNYLEDINHVRNILQKHPSIHVEISAFVGPTWLAVQMGAELEGRSPAVYRLYGALMDARANKVRDMLILLGTDPARIITKRGESGIGEAFRKVDFRFFVP
jgi:hypothetical protein